MKARHAGRSRRGTAGIVAAVFMFAMLFTVGTSYFLFVSALNQQYSQNLMLASSKQQSVLSESLIVSTLLATDNDVAFYVNNTSSLTANMTVVLLMSSAGTLLKCDGVGLPGTAGCSNTTPALWIVVNSGKGSAIIDTGYLYVTGTVDTVKVITERGNSFTATYPPTANQNSVQANTAQSLTVDPTTLKWTTLQTSPASLTQSKYTANCASSNCGTTLTSAVAAGDTLVFGLGWFNQNPPGTPTDPLGTTFTLGVSNSVVYTYSPAYVQGKYTANCASATCGATFTSNVAVGDGLVFGLGWFNANPPGTPTDTRGSTFTLAASNSVTVVPPSPLLKQSNYLANCASSTCQLAFGSNVVAGDTLVYGLGWYAGMQYYVPVTITNNVGSGLAVDAAPSPADCEGANSCSITISTTNPNDLIYFSITDSNGNNILGSVSDTAGLSWTQRQSVTSSNYDVYTYYAITSGTLTSDSITASFTGNNTPNIRMFAIAVSGVNLAAPFDPNLSSAPTNTGTSGSPTITFSTTNANDLVIGTTKDASSQITGGASGYTLELPTNPYAAFEYRIYSATGSKTPSFTASSNSWGEIGDAIEAAPTTSTQTTFQEQVTWNPSTYSTYEATDLGNIRFCADSQCATQLYGWLESCTTSCTTSATSATAWVKLTSAIAGNGGTTTIYMVFLGTSVDFDGSYWGEAPNLSSTYAQYDNGVNVFNAYFNGNTATSSFSVASGYTLAQATGVTYGSGTINALKLTGYGSNTTPLVFSTQLSNAGTVTESNLENTNHGTDSGAAGLVDNAAAASVTNAIGANTGYQNAYFNIDYRSSGTTTSGVDQMGTAATAWIYGSATYMGSTSGLYLAYVAPQLYSASGGYSANPAVDPITGAAHLYLGYVYTTSSGAQANMYYNWGRSRAFPPGGVMPSTSFGSVSQGNIPPTPTDTRGNTYVVGVSKTVTSGLNTYFSYVWYTTTGTAGADTITASFATTVTGSISIYEIQGYTTAGIQTSVGNSPAGSNTASVSSFTPASNSFVVGNTETASGSSVYTAGSPFALVAACSSVYGCSEYKAGLGTATTVSMTLGSSTQWAEAAMSFPPATTTVYYSYVWYATAAGSGADTISATFSGSVAGSVSIFEFSGVTTATGVLSSTGGSSTAGATASVSPSISPAIVSAVVGNVEGAATTFTAGTGLTLPGTCSTVSGCGEYQTGVSSPTSVPMSMSPSQPWVESAVSLQASQTTYYSYIWYGPAASASPTGDTITASFSQTVTGSATAYELNGYSNTGITTSTGGSPTGSTSASVTQFTPGLSSVVIGDIEGGSTTYTAGGTFTRTGTCTTVYGCGEYQTGVSSATTAPFTLSISQPWVETAIAFRAAPAVQSGNQVGGYPADGIPYLQYLAWSVAFTNQDPKGRAVTLWPKSLAAITSIMQETVEITPFFIVDGVTTDGTSLIQYGTTQSYITIPYKHTVTVYFGAMTPLGTTPDRADTSNEIAPFMASFALEGIYSDNSLFSLTVPYAAGMVTQANAKSTPVAATSGTQVTVSCTNPCYFNPSSSAYVGWLDSTGHMTIVKTFTTDSSGNIPSGVTFNVPTAAIGYYTIVVSDYVNTTYLTFQHT